MKQLILIICLFSLVSCLKENKNLGDSNDYIISQKNTSENNSQTTVNSNKTKLHKIKNKQFGMLFGVMPIPSTWKIVQNETDNIMFEDPNGTKIYYERYNRFYFSNNQQQNYYSEQNGTKVMAPKNIEQVIREDFVPFLESKGLKLVNQYPLPQLAKLDQQLDNAMFKSVPEEKRYSCMVTEWEDKEGNKSLGVIRHFTNYYTTIGGMDWGYTLNAMEAPEAFYEASKRDYINALLNLKVNPNWLRRNNQHYAQKSQQSSIQHQQRMASIRAQGQAIINNGNTYSSILDSNHESWKRRNAMTDAGHAKSVDAIWERNTMTDQSGNTYQVDGYNKNVWKNNNNEYIGTDNTNWNPNTDITTNSIDWEKLEYSDDNY